MKLNSYLYVQKTKLVINGLFYLPFYLTARVINKAILGRQRIKKLIRSASYGTNVMKRLQIRKIHYWINSVLTKTKTVSCIQSHSVRDIRRSAIQCIIYLFSIQPSLLKIQLTRRINNFLKNVNL